MAWALVQKHSGYSGRSEGPNIENAADWVELADINLPDLSDGQVRVKMAMASVNPSDLHFIKGEYGQPRVQGAAAGFEGIGEVVEGNGDYAKSLIGQRVCFVVAKGGSGTWAEFAITDAATCIPAHPNLRDEDGAGLVVNPLTAMAMFDLVKTSQTGSFVMTAANSQLCKLIAGLGKDAGVKPICLVRDKSQATHLKDLGAEVVLDTSASNFADAFLAVSHELKPRILLDAVGSQLSADVFMAMPNRTRWVVYGKLDTRPPMIAEMGQFVFSGKVIEGFWLAKWFTTTKPDLQMATIKAVQKRFVTGAWKTEVTSVLSLAQVLAELPQSLAKGGKVMLAPGVS
jgi:NADPH:quinone reductase-like Zn-dependent oxidoreductase